MLPNSGTPSRLDHDRAGDLPAERGRLHQAVRPLVHQDHGTRHLVRWWAMYGKHLPHLSSVARRVLAQPVCASAAERNWSVYGMIKTSARGRMGHAVADKFVYCHEALHMRSKLQTASYTQVVEKWDSDSDSDASDDDDLAM